MKTISMRKLFFALFTVMATVACSQSGQGYSIEGKAEGTADGDTVYLCEIIGGVNMNPVDSAYVKDGKFRFEGTTEGVSLRVLMPCHGGKPVGMAIVVLENAPIKAVITQKGKETTVVKGGPSQAVYENFSEGERAIAEKLDLPWQVSRDASATDAQRQAARRTIDSLYAALRDYRYSFIVSHVPSALSDMLFGFYADDFSQQQQDDILKLFADQQPQYPAYKAAMARRDAEKATAVGAQYTDLQMPGLHEGEVVKLSDYVGKYRLVLVDFWASWCGPCRAEMPSVLKAWLDFQDHGFQVVGVSFDNNHEAWHEAIHQMKMGWPQMSDLKGWESEGARVYNVRAIPANVLIDQQGKIVAKDLRGQALYNKVKELLK